VLSNPCGFKENLPNLGLSFGIKVGIPTQSKEGHPSKQTLAQIIKSNASLTFF